MGKSRVTFVIKAFQRPLAVHYLLQSIVEHGYGDYPIIVVDDSEHTMSCNLIPAELKDIRYVKTEFDIGLSAGRNLGVSMVDTEYFVMLDDDMLFTSETSIRFMAKLMECYEFDVLSGMCPGHGAHCFGRFVTGDRNGEKWLLIRFQLPRERLKHAIVTDYALNFFMGRTSTIQGKIGWPDEVKIGREHVCFFKQAYDHNMRVGISRGIKVGHKRVQSDRAYQLLRKRTAQYDIPSLDAMGIDAIKAIWPNGKTKFAWSRTGNFDWTGIG